MPELSHPINLLFNAQAMIEGARALLDENARPAEQDFKFVEQAGRILDEVNSCLARSAELFIAADFPGTRDQRAG